MRHFSFSQPKDRLCTDDTDKKRANNTSVIIDLAYIIPAIIMIREAHVNAGENLDLDKF